MTSDRQERIECAATWTPWILSAAFVLFLVAARWPEWWRWVVYEQSPMTWLESLLLYTIGLAAAAGAAGAYAHGEKKDAWRWSLLGVAFLFLALDERFALHERLRDSVLAPRGGPFLWIAPGDYVLLVFAAAGLALLPFFWPLFAGRPAARRCLIAALAASAAAVLVDTVDIQPWPADAQRTAQFWEEMLETAGMLFYLTAFVKALAGRLRRCRTDAISAGASL